MRNPRDFAKPLAIGAPQPVLEIPFKPSRMIHFLDFSNEKMVAKVPDIAPTVKGLVERIISLASAMHQLDQDASPDALARLDPQGPHCRL